MRHLVRTAVEEPACLSRFDPDKHAWNDVTRADKDEIRDRLGELQRHHCAYCECDVTKESNDPHIEHFEQRARARRKTFAWSNLFWSCTHPERCGKRKDTLAHTYLPSDLLKPDVDDPRQYLFFTSDGGVVPRAGLDEAGIQRAQETIRVFGLEDRALVAMRRAYLAGPMYELRGLQEAGFEPEVTGEFLRELAEVYGRQPFSAAALDVLGIAP